MKDHLGFRIKKMMVEKNISIKEVIIQLGITRAGLYEIFKRKDLNTDLLRKLSIILKIPMSYWFNDNKEKQFDNFYYLGENECGIKLSEALKLIETLQEKIKNKDELLSVKDELISILKNQKNN